MPRKPGSRLYPLPGAQYISFQNLEPFNIGDFCPKKMIKIQIDGQKVNIARGTKDPEIDSVTWTLATTWRHLD